MKSAEEITLSKLSPLKIKKTIIKKPKTKNSFKKKKFNGTRLIEICNKNQADEILKWKHFEKIKIKTYPNNSLNTYKGIVKSHELSLCTSDEIKTNLQDQNITEIRIIKIKNPEKQ